MTASKMQVKPRRRCSCNAHESEPIPSDRSRELIFRLSPLAEYECAAAHICAVGCLVCGAPQLSLTVFEYHPRPDLGAVLGPSLSERGTSGLFIP